MKVKLTLIGKRALLFLTVCFLFTLPLPSQAADSPQEDPVTLNRQNTTIRSILEEIERTTPYKFFYNEDIVDADKTVSSFAVTNRPLKNVLDMLFEGTNITYRVVDSQVVLSVRPQPTGQGTVSTRISVSGTVSDTNGAPVPGVSVIEKGTLNGTPTGSDGRYSITVERDAILEFSFIGYTKLEEPVNGRTNVNVILQEDVFEIGTVVAIGYGSQRKEDLSMAVSNIRVDDALKSGPSDIGTILQGRIPGLTVLQSGDPMRDTQFAIRGRGSKGNDSDPASSNGVLFVVDGVPNAPFMMDDVEEITVLKDAASASIYGAQVGAGGVVLITTKKAQAGKTRVDVNISTGFQRVSNLPSLLTAEQYVDVWHKAAANSSTGAMNNALADVDNYPWMGVTRTDWLKEIFQTGRTQHYGATISGGNETTLNLFSIQYDKKEGTLKNTYSQSVAAKMSTDFTPFKWLRFSERINVRLGRGQGDVNTGHEGPIQAALWYPRSASVYELNDDGSVMLDDNGNKVYGGTSPKNLGIGAGPKIYNPVAYLDRMHRRNPKNEFFSTTSLEIKPVKGLTIRSDFTGDFTYEERDEYYAPMTEIGLIKETDNREQYFYKRKHWLSETTATYAQAFGKHHISAMIGFSADWKYRNEKIVKSENYSGTTNREMLWDSAGSWERIPEEATQEYSLASVISRLGYSFDDRYFLVASIRRDASSKLPSDNNSDLFPALSASWKLSSEPFFKNLGWDNYLDFVKIRGGWGKIGNVDLYDEVNIVNIALTKYSDGAVFGKNSDNQRYGTYLSTIPNPNAVWETTTQVSAGMDLSFFNGALDITVDYYNKATKDLVDQLPTVVHTGVIEKPWGNVGKVINKGWEFSANYSGRTGEWSYNLWGNYTKNKGYVKEYGSSGQPQPHTDLSVLLRSQQILYSYAGYSWRSFYVYRSAGIFQSMDDVMKHVYKNPETGETKILQPDAKPGDIRWVDVNNDGEINDADRELVGSYDPPHTFAFGGSVSWKGFDLSIMFQGVSGNYIYNGAKNNGMLGMDYANMYTDILNTWDYNSASKYPRMGIIEDPNNNYQVFSDLFVERGDYLKLKNLTLGYTLPRSVMAKISMPSCKIRVYFSAENLATFTKYSGIDPEVGNYGLDRGTYPVSKFYNFGINLNF